MYLPQNKGFSIFMLLLHLNFWEIVWVYEFLIFNSDRKKHIFNRLLKFFYQWEDDSFQILSFYHFQGHLQIYVLFTTQIQWLNLLAPWVQSLRAMWKKLKWQRQIKEIQMVAQAGALHSTTTHPMLYVCICDSHKMPL